MLSVPWDYSVNKQLLWFNEREMNAGTLAVIREDLACDIIERFQTGKKPYDRKLRSNSVF